MWWSRIRNYHGSDIFVGLRASMGSVYVCSMSPGFIPKASHFTLAVWNIHHRPSFERGFHALELGSGSISMPPSTCICLLRMQAVIEISCLCVSA